MLLINNNSGCTTRSFNIAETNPTFIRSSIHDFNDLTKIHINVIFRMLCGLHSGCVKIISYKIYCAYIYIYFNLMFLMKDVKVKVIELNAVLHIYSPDLNHVNINLCIFSKVFDIFFSCVTLVWLF